MKKQIVHPLNDYPEFRKELAALLKKYNCNLSSWSDEDLFVTFIGKDCVPLNQYNEGYAGADNIGPNEVQK